MSDRPNNVFIHAVGEYYDAYAGSDGGVDIALTDLKAHVAAAVGQPVRRIGRFIQLALIGAGRCRQAANSSSDTAVYLGSGRGDLEIAVEVMQTLLRDGHPPKPLSFINTVSNAACYYIAQNLKLLGRSSFVCNRYFAFEAVLQLAELDIQAGAVFNALVGAVDLATSPLSEHRERLQLPSDAPVAEASHWLHLSANADGAQAQLLAARNFSDRRALSEWLRAQRFQSCLLSGGDLLSDNLSSNDFDELAQAGGLTERFDYLAGRAYYDCRSGAALSEFLRRAEPQFRQLLHINRDPSGRYAAIWVERS